MCRASLREARIDSAVASVMGATRRSTCAQREQAIVKHRCTFAATVTTPLLLNHVPLQSPSQYRLSYSFNTTPRHTHALPAHLNRPQQLLSRIPSEAVRPRQCYLHGTERNQGSGEVPAIQWASGRPRVGLQDHAW